MFSVFIADDEYMIVEGLKRMVDWEKNGYRVVGDAGSGFKAMNMIRDLRPDIVLTDIKMPGMSGLELIENVRKEKIGCRFIIISGFRDFQYCRDALRLGVSDYLLKPIDFSLIIPKLDKISDAYANENAKKDAVIRQFFTCAFSNAASGEYPDSVNCSGYIPYDYIYSVCAVRSASGGSIDAAGYSSYSDFYYHMPYRGNHLLILGFRDKQSAGTGISGLRRKLSINIKLIGKFPAAFAVGPLCSLGNIKGSFRTAAESVENEIFYRTDDIVPASGNINGDTLSFIKSKVNGIISSINTFDELRTENAVSDLINFIILNNLPKSYVVSIIYDLYVLIGNTYNVSMRNGRSNPLDEAGKLDKMETIDEMRSSVNMSIHGLILSLKTIYSKGSNPISKIKDFIDTHYAESISLNSTAKKFFFNPSYLSRLFKEKENVNFSDYLNSVRVEKAKGLLLKSDFNVNKVSSAVGFSNYRYFTKVFKRYTGLAPLEWKKLLPASIEKQAM